MPKITKFLQKTQFLSKMFIFYSKILKNYIFKSKITFLLIFYKKTEKFKKFKML